MEKLSNDDTQNNTKKLWVTPKFEYISWIDLAEYISLSACSVNSCTIQAR